MEALAIPVGIGDKRGRAREHVHPWVGIETNKLHTGVPGEAYCGKLWAQAAQT